MKIFCNNMGNKKGANMKIFVGNISAKVTEELLRKAFGKYGEVESVTIMGGLMNLDDTQDMAFVEMPDEENALKAIKKMNRKMLKWQKLNVHIARAAKEDRRSSERGGGRRANDPPEVQVKKQDSKLDKKAEDFKTETDLFGDLDM